MLLIDEAQNLNYSVLELVRMLSNFETARSKLIQIILAGTPQLASTLESRDLLQLRQRVSIIAGLKHLTAEATSFYIAHRLQMAGGCSDADVFTDDALTLISQSSEGIPRNINNLCFTALSLGFASQRRPIDRDIISEAIAHLQLASWRTKGPATQQTEQQRTLKAFEVSSSEDRPAMFLGWRARITVAVVVFLAASGVLFESRRWLSRPASPAFDPTEVVQPGPAVYGQSDLRTSARSAQMGSTSLPSMFSGQRNSSEPLSLDPNLRTNDGTPPQTIPGSQSSFSANQTTHSMGTAAGVPIAPRRTHRKKRVHMTR